MRQNLVRSFVASVAAGLLSTPAAMGQYRLPIEAVSGSSSASSDDPDGGPYLGPYLYSFIVGAYVDHDGADGSVQDWQCNTKATSDYRWCATSDRATTYDGHQGWDIIAGHDIYHGGDGDPVWTDVPVLSPADGVVEYADPVKCKSDNCTSTTVSNNSCHKCDHGLGNHLLLRDRFGNLITLGHYRYNTIAVEPGTFVACGAFTGYVGSSGYSTTPHIHHQVNKVDKKGGQASSTGWPAGAHQDPFAGECKASDEYLRRVSGWTVQPSYCALEVGRCYSCDVEPGARRHKPASEIKSPLWYMVNYGEDELGTDADQDERKAFQNAYNYFGYKVDGEDAPVSESRLGCPFDAGGGAFVHEVYGVVLQNFQQPDPALRFVEDGQSVLIYNKTLKKAFLLHSGFFGAYKCMSDQAAGHPANGGATLLGAPTSNEEKRRIGASCNDDPSQPEAIVQTFEKGCMWWNGDGNVHIHPAPADVDATKAATCNIALVPNPPGPGTGGAGGSGGTGGASTGGSSGAGGAAGSGGGGSGGTSTGGTGGSGGSGTGGSGGSCASNYCQSFGHGSGSYCDGSDAVACAVYGGCPSEFSRNYCQYGCSGGSCLGCVPDCFAKCGGASDNCGGYCYNSCPSGFDCPSGVCTVCGGPNQHCCDGTTCSSGLNCTSGTCSAPACTDTYQASALSACFDNPGTSGTPTLCIEVQQTSGPTWQWRACKSTGQTFGPDFSYVLHDYNNSSFSSTYQGSGGQCTPWHSTSLAYLPGYGTGNGAGMAVDIKSPSSCTTSACKYTTGEVTIALQCL